MSFHIHFTNIRGFKSNFNEIQSHLALNKPAVLSLGETQVTHLGGTNDWVCAGYTRLELLIPHRGLILFVRNDVCYNSPTFIASSSNPLFNTLWVEIKVSSHSIFLCSLYRSPSLSHADTCCEFDKLSSTIDDIYRVNPSAEIAILGDFNVHNNSWLGFSNGRDNVGEAAELFAGINLLSQLVDKPTRYPDRSGQSSHLLDLFLTTHPNKYSVDVTSPLGLSDHALVVAQFPLTPNVLELHPPRLIWHFERANWVGLNQFYFSFDWKDCFVSNNADKVANCITSTIMLGIKKFIPSSYLKPKVLKNKWFNGNCQRAISTKKAAHLIYLRDPSVHNLVKFRVARNEANNIINRAKKDYDIKVRDQMRRVLNSRSSNRTFWSFAGLVKRNFIGKTSSLPILFQNGIFYKTSNQKAHILAQQFSSASNLPPNNQSPPVFPLISSTMSKVNFRVRVVSKVLSNLDPNKATGPDGIPSIVLKHCYYSLAKPLSKLFHLSMLTGVFPTLWKTANIHPVPKKGDKSSPSNYRPIALLSVLSKVMESIVNFHIVKYLDKNKILSDRQYGFRKSRCAGDLMTYLVHCWDKSIERWGESSVVSLDISKAFDRVWHECLVSKLRSLNLHSSLIGWITDYLSTRKIRVVCDGISSKLYDINAGVPQGSSLSPTLFLIYINDLLSLTSCDIHSFADDTTLSSSIEFCCQRDSSSQLAVSRSLMNDSVLLNTNLVIEWGKSNRVEFNPNKFQACVFSQKSAQPYMPPVINGILIERCSSIKMLGLQISSDLSWKDHIFAIAKKASQCLGFIRRCNFYFEPSEVLRLYKAYIRPLMEYNSFVWGGAPKTHLACLDKIQNRVVKMINNDSITSSLDSLEHRRKVCALSVFYKYYFGNCSLEIKSLVPVARVARANTRFDSRQHKFAVELFRSRTSHFKSSFFPRVASMWNQIDESVFPDRFNPQVFKKNVGQFLKSEGSPA